MNAFDSGIQTSRQKHLKTQLVLGFIILPAALILTLWLAFAKGYNVIVGPEKIAPTVSFSVVSGFGLFYEDKLYILGDNASFSALARGYISHIEPLTKDSDPSVYIELKPKPGRVLASTLPEVAEVAWHMDGKLLTIERSLNIEVQPGRHELKLDSPYHQVISEPFDILNDEEKTWQFELTPVKGQIAINSRPQGASVVLNGANVGYTPVTLARPGGEYLLRLSQSGYEDTDEMIVLTNQQPQANRDYHLVAKKGFVTFALAPSGGTLLVDGKKVSNSSRVPLAANQQHSVLYQRSGYYSHKQQLSLEPGSEEQVRIQLKREFGQVVLQAKPTALVVIDGKPMGKTPVETRLSAVPHKVEFKLPGYRTVTKTITPSGKTPTLLSENLLTEYDARRKENKPTKAETLGIKMARFKPDKLLMGAKTSEKGRRRNEFVRNIEFTRPVAVSRHEISEAQFASFRSAATSATANNKSNLPVTDISWTEAAMFCNWLSKEDGLLPFYKLTGGRYQGVNLQSKGYRLPTEAEWEWLAKRARRSVETKYVWGNIDRVPKEVGNFRDEAAKDKNAIFIKGYDDGHEGKAPIGSFKADRIGLYDLVGNVSEWVHDIYTNVPPDGNVVLQDPLGSTRGNSHLYKGASYDTGRIKELRAAWREPSADKAPTIGFRIARYF